MTKLGNILSIVFGVFWLIFGFNGLFHFFPIPAPPAETAYFMEALQRSGYALPMIYGTEVIGGLLLVLSLWQPIALLLLAPITANIVLYDLVLNPKGLAIGIVVAVIHAFLLWRKRMTYMGLMSS